MRKTTATIILAAWVVILAAPASFGGDFTQEQVDQGQLQVQLLQKQGNREVVGQGVYYTWNGDWYAMSYDRQLRTIRAVADAEYVASQGAIRHMHIEYGGDKVAEATPTGGVRVLKSRP